MLTPSQLTAIENDDQLMNTDNDVQNNETVLLMPLPIISFMSLVKCMSGLWINSNQNSLDLLIGLKIIIDQVPLRNTKKFRKFQKFLEIKF